MLGPGSSSGYRLALKAQQVSSYLDSRVATVYIMEVSVGDNDGLGSSVLKFCKKCRTPPPPQRGKRCLLLIPVGMTEVRLLIACPTIETTPPAAATSIATAIATATGAAATPATTTSPPEAAAEMTTATTTATTRRLPR